MLSEICEILNPFNFCVLRSTFRCVLADPPFTGNKVVAAVGGGLDGDVAAVTLFKGRELKFNPFSS